MTLLLSLLKNIAVAVHGPVMLQLSIDCKMSQVKVTSNVRKSATWSVGAMPL